MEQRENERQKHKLRLNIFHCATSDSVYDIKHSVDYQRMYKKAEVRETQARNSREVPLQKETVQSESMKDNRDIPRV